MDLIGKQLPSVSAADNGKFLGVDNGRWQPITPTYDKEIVDALQGDITSLYEIVRLNKLLIDVSGTTATLDLTAKGGIQPILVKYLAGANLQFAADNSQYSPDNLLIFTVCGFDPDQNNLHLDLSCISDGKAYYVRLLPVDTNVMRGTLYIYTFRTK